jgi:hypothetical protein
MSSSRSAVGTLRDKLESLPWVARVEAPLKNFTLAPGAEFSFSLYLQ